MNIQLSQFKHFASSAWALIWQTARLPVGLISCIPVVMLMARTGSSPAHVSLAALPIAFITMAGFLLNDIFDEKRDLHKGPRKPIAFGSVARSSAQIATIALVVSGIALAVLTSHAGSVFVIVSSVIGVFLYSPIARRVPVLKGAITAILCCTPFLYASALTGVQFPAAYYFLLTLFIVGRELLLDVRDFQWDRASGMKTLVEYLTPTVSQIFGWVLMILSLIGLTAYSTDISRMIFETATVALVGTGLIYLYDNKKGLAASRLVLLLATIAAAS
ncbi:MAG TPA: UbiA family prenyltransferase [Rhizomicrobium sp.]|nr:UbiA family prenyltransferase [Rhizomicrobium sp.]